MLNRRRLRAIGVLGSALALLFAAYAESPSRTQSPKVAKTNGTGDPGAGAKLFAQHCATCHSVRPDLKVVGPSVYGVMRGPHALKPAEARAIITNGKGRMPSFSYQFNDGNTSDLIAYLRTL